MSKYVVHESKVLIDFARGLYSVTTVYSDGSLETRTVPLGLIQPPVSVTGVTYE